MNPNAISAFEYVTILISIILGLGITQILSSIAESIYDYKKVRFFYPHTIWVIVILFFHIQEWFIIYELKEYPIWKLPTFLFIILYPINLFIITKLLFPVAMGNDAIDLKQYYLDNFQKIFYLFCISILLSVSFNIFFLHAPLGQQLLLLVPFAVFLWTAFIGTKKEWIHKSIAIFFLLVIIITTVVEQNKWYVK